MPQFADPYFLFSALVVIVLVWIYLRRNKRGFPSVNYPALSIIRDLQRNRWKPTMRHLPVSMKLAALLLLAVALARPQSVSKGQDVHAEGIDLVLILDISASMLAQDFKPDRVGAAKEVAAEFIKGRSYDRIGLVLFAKQAFTQCPLTIDHDILLELIDGVEIGLADPDKKVLLGHPSPWETDPVIVLPTQVSFWKSYDSGASYECGTSLSWENNNHLMADMHAESFDFAYAASHLVPLYYTPP